MNFDSIITELESIVNSYSLDVIPYAKGNSIRIKNYAIRKSKNSYKIFDCKDNICVAEVDFKISAIAIAKSLSEGKDAVSEIKQLDQKFSKNYNDVLVYKHIIKNSKSRMIKETRRSRLAVSLEELSQIKFRLEDFVFGDK